VKRKKTEGDSITASKKNPLNQERKGEMLAECGAGTIRIVRNLKDWEGGRGTSS